MSNIDKLNLIRPGPIASIKKTTALNPAATAQERQVVADGGKVVPSNGSPGHLSEVQKRELAKATRDVSGYIQNITRELNFSIDEELDRTVITVIDEETGDVIRQIPTEEILSIARNIAQIKDADSGKGFLFKGDA